MNEKMSLEKFTEIKKQLASIIQKYNALAEQHENDKNYDMDLLEKNFVEEYLKHQSSLLNYDLSDIPFEAWKDFIIGSDETHAVDFSKTKANIDFNIVDYPGNCNFKGCNIRNLDKIYSFNPNDFDGQTIQMNSKLSLSDTFSNEFKEKYYKRNLTIADLASLSLEQLEEIKQKEFIKHVFGSSGLTLMLETLGLDKAIELYNHSEEEFDAVIQTMDMYYDINYVNKNTPTFDELLKKAKNIDVSEIKNACFDFLKEKITKEYYYHFNPIDFPESFIRENPDIFLVNVNIPDEVKKRYFGRKLILQDLFDYPKAFQNISVDFFMDDSYLSTISQFISNNYGVGKFQELVQKHQDLFEHISEKRDFYNLSQFLQTGKDLDSTFDNAVKKYFLNYGMPEQYSVASEEQTIYNVPDWLSSMHFQLIDKITSMNDLMPYNESLVVLDKNQRIVLDALGIDNIKRFEQETGFFSHPDNKWGREDLFSVFCSYFNTHNPNELVNEGIDFKNGSLSYEDFLNQIANCLDNMRKNKIFRNYNDYGFIQGEFRECHPEIFMNINAPEKLQELFYKKSITPRIIAEHPEYIQYLKGKDLSSCFEDEIINIDGSNAINHNENLYKFIGSKTDFNGVMNFITEYSDILDIVFDRKDEESYQYKPKFTIDDDIDKIKNRINEALRKLILEKGFAYPKHIPKDLIEQYPSMFLDENVPQELQEAFYNRTISAELVLSNPSYMKYLKNIDLEVLFKYMPVNAVNEKHVNEQVNLVSGIKQVFGSDEAFDIMLLYGKYIEKVFEDNKLEQFKFNQNFSKTDLLDEMDKAILQNIIDGKMKYDEKIPSHFKNNNPTLFLGENVSQDIKDKFYNRQFTINDFNDNPKLFDIFDKTNITCGFSENMSWIIPLFNNSENLKIANYNRMKLILAYSRINDTDLQDIFKDYVMEDETDIDLEKTEYISKAFARLSETNSIEMFKFRKELARQLLKTEDPLEKLNKVEDIFIKNNIPTIGKIYSCFEILHPDFQGFDFKENSKVSPVLKKVTTRSKKIIVFSDLIKCAFGSNNRSVNAYLKNIDFGSGLYEKIKNGQVQFDSLGENEKQELKIFSKHLATLYNNTTIAKVENKEFKSSGDVLNDIFELSKKLSPDGTLDYNLADRAIRMFCWSTEIDTLDQAKKYIEQKIKTADSRNRNASTKDMTLEQGDFIKGIEDIKYLGNILQNGSVSKEYLGSDATSDGTPLDTDISMIMSSEGTINEKIKKTAAHGYGRNGGIWFVLKNDDRFVNTRTSRETENAKRDMSKIEVFYTGAVGQDHHGIRTGFASSEINYIVMENYNPKVGLEIAINGFYIPVANKEGKIIFTPKDYDKLREKMSGLSYYGEDSYSFSENLVTKETEELAQKIEQSNYEVQVKREKINNIIKKSLEELGLNLKTDIDGDLTEGFVELIDTGSTGRGTNKPGDGDFDFMMRLDKAILSNSSKLDKLKQTILKNLGKENSSEITGAGDFRLKGVQIDNKTNVDIDITFTKKTDKIAYSTDMALRDRLSTIKKIDPEKYKYVVANILLAKRVLKEAGAYKPNRGEIPQGGLGGVGIENWILQNGGSFIDAAKSFVAEAERKSFSEFQSTYQIWDFGDNHLAERNEQYPHDNFVSKNMSDAGYQRMVQALEDYLKTMEINQNLTEEIKK